MEIIYIFFYKKIRKKKSKVDALVQNAIKKGASIKLGGKRSSVGELFFEPTVITNVTNEMVWNALNFYC